MKVKENGSDRIAEAHIHVDGKQDPLEEYGEYVDPKDKAICCYIPVEEGDVLKIFGRFSGKVRRLTNFCSLFTDMPHTRLLPLRTMPSLMDYAASLVPSRPRLFRYKRTKSSTLIVSSITPWVSQTPES